jgi:exonuclease SbcC
VNTLLLRLVEVENFMNHEYERLEFGPGVIQLDGPSGNGKSSLVVDAPGFALFDWKATRFAKLTKDRLRNRHSDNKAFRVKVAFERTDGFVFEVERGVNASGNPYVRYHDNVIDRNVEGSSEVRAKLVEVIGFMDAETYHRSFVTRQQSHEVLTDMPRPKRKDFVNRMLGIDVFSDMVNDLRKAGREHTKRVRELQELLGGQDIEKMEREIEQLDVRIEQLRTRQQTVQQEVEQAAQQAAEQARKAAELAPLIARRREIDGQVAVLAATIARLEGQLASDNAAERERMNALVSGKAELVREGKALAARVTELEELARAASQTRLLAERVSAARSRAQELASAVGERPEAEDPQQIAAGLKELEEQRVQLMSELADVERRLQTVEAGTCATCGRDYEAGEAHEHGEQLQAQRERVAGELAQVEEQTKYLREREQVAREAQQRLALWQQRSQTAEQADGEAQRLEAELAQAAGAAYDEAEHERAKERLTELRMLRQQTKEAEAWLQENPDPASLRQQLQAQVTEREELVQQLAELPSAEDAHAVSQAEIELRRRESELRASMAQAQSELADAERQAEQAQSRLARLADAARESSELHRQIADKNLLADLTEAFWKRLSDEIRPQLSDIASDIMGRISHGVHSRIELTDDYSLLVFDDEGGAFDAMELSGGEKDRINFAMHVALTRLITHRTGTPIGYLVLDEVFAGQDEGHIEQMVDILSTLQAHYPQMFLISHANLEDYEFVRYRFEVTERKGRSRVRAFAR